MSKLKQETQVALVEKLYALLDLVRVAVAESCPEFPSVVRFPEVMEADKAVRQADVEAKEAELAIARAEAILGRDLTRDDPHDLPYLERLDAADAASEVLRGVLGELQHVCAEREFALNDRLQAFAQSIGWALEALVDKAEITRFFKEKGEAK